MQLRPGGSRLNKSVLIKWLKAPDEQDYPAAQSYLDLVFEPTVAAHYVQQLKSVEMIAFKAKDIFRASGLPLLGIADAHVARDHNKISSGQELSPLLLVRDLASHRVIIADGYHRLCAVYSYDEDAMIPCKIA